MLWAPARICSKCSLPIAMAVIKLMAEHKEYRPPTQLQIGTMVSIPNSLAFERLAVTAIKCCVNRRGSSIHCFAFFALNKVSSVVNDLEEIMNKVVSGFKAAVTRLKPFGSASE